MTIGPKYRETAPRSASKGGEAIRYLPQEFSRVSRNEFPLLPYAAIPPLNAKFRSVPFPVSLHPVCFLANKLNKTRATPPPYWILRRPLGSLAKMQNALVASSTFDLLDDFPRLRGTRSTDTNGWLPLPFLLPTSRTRTSHKRYTFPR